MSSFIPKSWTLTSIGEITNSESLFKDGDWVESKDQDPSGNNRLIQLADVGDGRFINKSSRFMNDEQFTRLKCTELKKGDVLVARMPEPLGRACIYPLNNTKAATIVDIAIIRTKNADHYWLMSAINSSDFRYHIDLNASGTTRTRIARSALSKLKLIAPPLPEQQKIAKILTSVDEVIEKTQAQIDKLKDLKTGMMQELLTNGIGHTEFKDSPVGRIPAEWEVKRLAEVFELSSGSTPSRKESHYFSTDIGATPWVKTLDMHDGKIIVTDEKITKEAIENSSCKILPIGTTIVAMYGGWNQIGRSGVLAIEATTNQAICALKFTGEVLGEFANYWLISKRSIWKSVAASSRKDPNITKQDVSNFLIVIPSIIEQKEVVIKLDSLTNQVNNKKILLSRYQSIKKALMQDLLTGKVRVKVEPTS